MSRINQDFGLFTYVWICNDNLLISCPDRAWISHFTMNYVSTINLDITMKVGSLFFNVLYCILLNFYHWRFYLWTFDDKQNASKYGPQHINYQNIFCFFNRRTTSLEPFGVVDVIIYCFLTSGPASQMIKLEGIKLLLLFDGNKIKWIDLFSSSTQRIRKRLCLIKVFSRTFAYELLIWNE